MQEAPVCAQFERDRARVNVRLAMRKHTGYALGKFYFSVADACRDMSLMYVYSVHCISVVYIWSEGAIGRMSHVNNEKYIA